MKVECDSTLLQFANVRWNSGIFLHPDEGEALSLFQYVRKLVKFKCVRKLVEALEGALKTIYFACFGELQSKSLIKSFGVGLSSWLSCFFNLSKYQVVEELAASHIQYCSDESCHRIFQIISNVQYSNRISIWKQRINQIENNLICLLSFWR